jgi:hypothetical protein
LAQGSPPMVWLLFVFNGRKVIGAESVRNVI